jgi:hypothetical protein
MSIDMIMGIVFATTMLGPMLFILIYLTFKKDPGDKYNALQLFGLRVQI